MQQKPRRLHLAGRVLFAALGRLVPFGLEGMGALLLIWAAARVYLPLGMALAGVLLIVAAQLLDGETP